MVNQVAPQAIAKVAELHASLSPEQKVKVVEYLERFKGKMSSYDNHPHH